jgi:hypothetical protein
MPTTTPDPTRRLEDLVLIAILLVVAGFAGAASFTHVKDWTLANSPAGTGEWFGWANAVISELVPIAALLTIRRRRRTGAPIGYPLALLTAAAGLSLAAQLAVAKPGPSGWLLSAVPALAFTALAKLVLTPVTPTNTDTTTTISGSPVGTPATVAADAAPEQHRQTRPEIPAFRPEAAAAGLEVPAQLLPTARFAVVNHEQTTGRPITVDELAVRMSVTPTVAGALLATIDPPTAPGRINGTPIGGIR